MEMEVAIDGQVRVKEARQNTKTRGKVIVFTLILNESGINRTQEIKPKQKYTSVE